MLKVHTRNSIKNARTLSAIDQCGFNRNVTDRPDFNRWVREITDAEAAEEIRDLANILGHISLLLLKGQWDDDDPLRYVVSPDIEGFSELNLRDNGYSEVFAKIFWSDAENNDNTEILSALIEDADPLEILRAYAPDECPDLDDDSVLRVPGSFELVVCVDIITRTEIPFGITTSDNRIIVYR